MKKTIKKRAFISAIAMLIVSAIVLTSSTFAWFSMAKRVEVETMNLNITSPEGVQISGNASAFTTTVTLSDLLGESSTRFKAYEGNRNHFPSVISPASSQFGTVAAEDYLPKFYSGKIGDTGLLSVSDVTDETASDFGVVVFDLFVKVKDAQAINFGSSTVACTANPDVPCAMRIGVVNCGLVEEGATGDALLNARTSTVATTNNHIATMFQTDAKHHTPYAVQNNGVVDGAATVVRTLHFLRTATNITPVGAITTNTGYVGPAKGTDVTTAGDAFFNAGAGINKIRVYLWMEGNDVDCSNDVAGSTIDFNFVLTIA